MIPTKPLFLTASVFLTACISLPDVEAARSEVRVVTPSETAYTKGTIQLQLEVKGSQPTQVELLINDEVLTTLESPYTFSWDTTTVAEGRYRISGRAQVAGQSFTSESREIVVDRTPPTVLSLSPEDEDSNVPVHQPIQVRFSEQLNVSSLTSDSIKVRVGDNNYVALTLSFSAQDNTLTITPTVAPTHGDSFLISIESSITDLAGNAAIHLPHTWSFDMPHWLDFGEILARGGAAVGYGSPDLQLDPQGNPIVLWREKLNSDMSSNLYVQRYVAGQGWKALGGPVNSIPIPANYSSKPVFQTLRLDSSGNPFVAWIQPDGPTPGVIVKEWKNDKWVTLGEPLTITFSGAPATPPQSLAFKLSSDNTPYVAWLQSDTFQTHSYIYVSYLISSSQTWLYPSTNYFAIDYSTNALPLSMDFLGGNREEPMITWEASDGVTVAYRGSGSWRYLPTIQAHLENSTPTASPTLRFVYGLGGAVVAFTEFDGTSHNIHVQHWTGTEWQPLGEALSAFPGDTPTMNVKLSNDSSGNLFIMWEEKEPTSGAFRKQFRRWLQETSTWEAVGAPPRNDVDALAPAFTVDASGNPFLAWFYGYPTQIYVYRLNQ
ncbi:Ig-like domain-containing protein [Hyalangium versicolor]|uniref:Ig-like domain-containing protein n=1 Tax=Hyalangium versicolor TaxID=2861190 RepID=UPI001CCE411E|nr:Ig-like domain-containing protein [Hyalangium versicolor]